MRLVLIPHIREHTGRCRHSSFLLALLLLTFALIYDVECGFMRKFFKNEHLKDVLTGGSEPKTKQNDYAKGAKNSDTRTAALVEELCKLDERLAARRRKEGRLDNYSQLMAKAQDHNREYDYHKHGEESDNCDRKLQQSGALNSASQGPQRARTRRLPPMNNARKTLQGLRATETPLEPFADQCKPTDSDCDFYQPSGNLYEALKPDFGNLSKNEAKQEHPRNSVLPKFMGNAPTYLKNKVKKVCDTTKKGLLEIVQQASDSISLLLKLDKKGRLLALIEEVDKAMVFVHSEYSKFVITWSPLMEDALNYLGNEDLFLVTWDERDEFDLRRDALILLAVGHEFHLLMLNWRNELLMAHSAYKFYLESVKQEALEGPVDGSPKVMVDDYFLFQLEAIHNYILFKAWLTIDEVNLEPRMKLAYLFDINDERLKNYESDYFRHIIIFQELFEPTLDEFKSERQQVIDSVGTAGVMKDDFEEVDEFLDDYRASMSADEQRAGKITVPIEMLQFVDHLKGELQYNPRLYDFDFLTDLKEAKRKLMED